MDLQGDSRPSRAGAGRGRSVLWRVVPPFRLDSTFSPAADQPKAIEQITASVNAGHRYTTLLGATGTGKTMTMAASIEALQKPALVLAHNKTLAAQLCNEFRAFFPDNAVEYFVSYYDYYQPEAYVPSRDLYIEKDSAINQEVDRLRHAATAALFARRDVIIVASVSAIYGMGSPETYDANVQILRRGEEIDRDELLRKLVSIQYTRNDLAFTRGTFRVRGEALEALAGGEALGGGAGRNSKVRPDGLTAPNQHSAPEPLEQMLLGDLVLPELRRELVDVVAFAIHRHGHRHVLHGKLVDRFHAQVGKAHHRRCLDGLGHQVGGATHGHQVGALVFLDGLDGDGAALGLADHGNEAGLGQHHLGEAVHAGGGGGACGFA